MIEITPVARAAFLMGGGAALARRLGVSAPTVHEWKTSTRAVPVRHCVAIFKMTEGQVTLQQLRPDDWEAIWPDGPVAPQLPGNAAPTSEPAAPRLRPFPETCK